MSCKNCNGVMLVNIFFKIFSQFFKILVECPFKKAGRKQRTNYRRISLLSLPEKVYAKCLERKCREILASKPENSQCGFLPGRNTTNQIFTLKQIFEKSWEYAKNLFAYFVDLEKAYGRVSQQALEEFAEVWR